MTIDTATVARALSRTLGGRWVKEWKRELRDRGYCEWFVWTNGEREVANPIHSTDVCLEMLGHIDQRPDCSVIFDGNEWSVMIGAEVYGIYPISGQPFRDVVIELCAGEE